MRAPQLLSVFVALAMPVLLPAAITEDEQRGRLKLAVEQAEEQIANSGMLVGDPALDAYLQGVSDQLFPEFRDHLKIHCIRDSEFNAFAMPSGSVYFNTGALLRIRDEAQLAAVLGHEGIHYTGDHGYKEVVHQKHAVVATWLGVLVQPELAMVVGVSSMAGYSREREREADAGGMQRSMATGYDTRAGAEVFDLMDKELTVRDIRHGGYFWSDHPRLKERVATMAELAGRHPISGERYGARYLKATEQVRLAALEIIHKRMDGKLLVFLLDEQKLLETLPPRARYYLAEGLRLRNAPGDSERAIAEYQATIKAVPDEAPAYQALGIRYMKEGKRVQALEMLRQYVALEPAAERTSFARQYIVELEQEKP